MQQTVETRTAVEHTRRTLHGIAECLLAGPQHRATSELALRITANGFATTAGPHLELDGLALVNSQGRRIDAVRTFGEVADALEVAFGRPNLGYADGSEAQASDPILLDHDEVRVLEERFAVSDGAARDATDLTTEADLLAFWREGLARIAAHDLLAGA